MPLGTALRTASNSAPSPEPPSPREVHRGFVPSFCVLIALGFALLSATSSSAADPESSFESARAWFAEKAALYERHPELKSTPGSGWKPYNRLLWEWQLGLESGTVPEPDALWRAWLDKEARFSRRAQPRTAWFSLGPENFAGRALAIAFHPLDPNTIYVGTAGGGLWRTTDEGASWTPITDDIPTLAVSGVAVSFTDPDVIVIATGELPTGLVGGIAGVGILRSTDAGGTWLTTSLTHTLIEDHGFHIVEAGTNGTFLAGARDGLWRSSDDGATWQQVRVGGDWFDVKWKPGNPNVVFAVKGEDATGNGVKISTNDGVNWSGAGTGQPPSFSIGKSKIGVTAANPDFIYAAYEDKQGTSFTGLYRSTDGGTTWQLRNSTVNVGGGQGWYNLSCTVDANDTEKVITGGVQLYRSTNGGTTLSQIGGGTVHVDHHDARYQPGSPNHLWVANDGGIWESTNDGASGSWVNKNNGLVTYQFYDICVAQTQPLKMAGGTQDNGTDVRNGSNTWSNGLFADGMVCNVDPTTDNILYGEIQFGNQYKSTNGGSNWFSNHNGLTPDAGLWVTPVAIDRNDPVHLYTMQATAGAGTGIYRTTNGGGHWEQVSTESPQSISISRVDGDVVWALAGTTLYTTDDGATWTAAPDYGFETGGEVRIMAHPTDVASAFVGFYSFNPTQAVMAMTTDFGATWTNVTGDLPVMPVRAIAIDPAETSHWYIGTDLGVWTSTNGGTNWTPVGTGMPNAVVWDLEIQDSARKLVAGTFGRGAWEFDIGIGTSAPEIASRLVNLMLDPPFPNPAQDEVVLRWASRNPGRARLEVFDVSGRLVSSLAERETGDGIIRTTSWLLEGVSSGVYFAILEAGGERVSRKIVVAE